jgi:cytochrome oxidase Cu insertion factor (SCO1/SenC/PrrC family)
MRSKAIQLVVLVAVCLATTVLFAQSEEADKSKPEATKDFTEGPGIEVGAELPEIKLKDQNGDEVSIRELAKSNTVALVFYRSADW